jgi:hypothetical protein
MISYVIYLTIFLEIQCHDAMNFFCIQKLNLQLRWMVVKNHSIKKVFEEIFIAQVE